MDNNPLPNIQNQSPQMEQSPVASAPNVPPQQPAPLPVPTPPTPDTRSDSPIAWIGLGLVAVAVILYIVTRFTDYSVPLNIITFACAFLGVIMAVVPAAIKKTKWTNWRVMSAILLGLFIATITTIGQIQSWILEAKIKNATSSLSSTSKEEPTTEDVLANEVNVVLGQFEVVNKGYYSEPSLPVTITNKSNERKTFRIEIEATTSDGTRILTDTVSANNLAPNQSVTEAAFDTVRESQLEQLKTATFKIIQAKAYTE